MTKQSQNLMKMPTLNMRPYQLGALETKGKDRGFELKLTLKESDYKFKLGESIYYGYPLEHSGRIEGILTKNKFNFANINLRNYELVRKNYNIDHID